MKKTKNFFKNMVKKIWLTCNTLKKIKITTDKNTYLFIPINGVGLGHLTRCLAVAKRLKEINENANIVFITTSIGITLIHKAGFICHHLPPQALMGSNTSKADWHDLFFKSIQNVVKIYKPNLIVFDGATPYLGLQKIIHQYRCIKYVWIKRGLYKDGINEALLDSQKKIFNLVISPNEVGEKLLSNYKYNGHIRVQPILLIDKNQMKSREEAKFALRLKRDAKSVYVQLGAGNLNGIEDMQEKIIMMLKDLDYEVVVGQAPIAIKSERNLSADQVIIDYPNSIYFNAFELGIMAGGYNSVAEAIYLGLPAIFIPNKLTGADDQVARVKNATNFGPYDFIEDFCEEDFRLKILKIQKEVLNGGGLCMHSNGAYDAAHEIFRLSFND